MDGLFANSWSVNFSHLWVCTQFVPYFYLDLFVYAYSLTHIGEVNQILDKHLGWKDMILRCLFLLSVALGNFVMLLNSDNQILRIVAQVITP